MLASTVPWNPTDRVLRQFAALGMAVLAGLAWRQARQDHDTLACICLAAAALAGPASLVWPRLVRPLFVGWMVLAFPVGWVLGLIAVAVLYYGVLTPLGLLFKLCGRDALCRRYQPELASYWAPRQASEVRSYFRSF